MSRLHQTLEQKAGRQLPQGVGVHAGSTKSKTKKTSKHMSAHK